MSSSNTTNATTVRTNAIHRLLRLRIRWLCSKSVCGIPNRGRQRKDLSLLFTIPRSHKWQISHAYAGRITTPLGDSNRDYGAKSIQIVSDSLTHRAGNPAWLSAPTRIRTWDLPLRRRTLYPAELPGRGASIRYDANSCQYTRRHRERGHCPHGVPPSAAARRLCSQGRSGRPPLPGGRLRSLPRSCSSRESRTHAGRGSNTWWRRETAA